MDNDAFTEFYQLHARALWAYIKAVTRSAQLADDLSQEAFLRFYGATSVHSSSDAHRKHYLFRIATNLIHDEYRRRRPDAEPVVSVPDRSAAVEAKDITDKALAQLKPRDRSLVWLAYAEGAGPAEIAAATGYTNGTARVMLHFARKRMAAAVEKLMGDN